MLAVSRNSAAEAIVPRPLYQWESIYFLANAITRAAEVEDIQNQFNSNGSATEPLDLSFARKIKRIISEQKVIQYQIAYLSTLGGAYHLCNRPHVALVIAMQQERVGRRMGSYAIIIRAKVFQAVNHRILGHRHRSRLLMQEAYDLVNRSYLEEVRSFVTACDLWLQRNYDQPIETEAQDQSTP